MNRVWLFAPVAGLTVLAGYLGLQLGQPVTETDVINFHAQQWVDTGPAGASLRDCVATPVDSADVWMAVTCTHENGTIRRVLVAPGGKALPPGTGPQI